MECENCGTTQNVREDDDGRELCDNCVDELAYDSRDKSYDPDWDNRQNGY